MISIFCFAQNNSGQSSIDSHFDGRLSYAQQIAKIENPTIEDIDKIISLYLQYATEGYIEYYDNGNGEKETKVSCPNFLSGLRNAFAAYLDLVERFETDQQVTEKYLFEFGEMFEKYYLTRNFYPRYRAMFYEEYLELTEPKVNKNIVDSERMQKAYSYLIYYFMNNKDLPKAKEFAKRYQDANILDNLENEEDEKERLEYILSLTQIPD